MDALKDFLTKAAELYMAAPAFFNWAAPIIVALIGGLIGVAYWLGGKFSESEVNGLKAQVALIDQRFNFAKEQLDLATTEASSLKTLIERLNRQVKGRAPALEVQNSTSLIEGNIGRLMGATGAASDWLGHVSTGFDDKGQLSWRPMRRDEAHLLGPTGPTGPEE
jgi:hypothetical protein